MRRLSSLDRVEFMISIAVFQKLEVSDKIKSNVVFLVSLLAGSIKPLNTKKTHMTNQYYISSKKTRKNTLTHWFSIDTREGWTEEKSTKKKNKSQFHVVALNLSFVLTIVVHVLKYFIRKSTHKVTFFLQTYVSPKHNCEN